MWRDYTVHFKKEVANMIRHGNLGHKCFWPGVIRIKFQPNMTSAEIEKIVMDLGLCVDKNHLCIEDEGVVYIAGLPIGSEGEWIEKFEAMPQITHAEHSPVYCLM